MYTAIIYDCDGTLLDSKTVTVDAYEEMIGRKLSAEEADSIFHQTRLETFAMLGIEESEENIVKIETLYEKGIINIKMFEGILEMIKEISSKNIHQGMATNRDFLSAKFAYESNDISDYIDDFISASDVENPKPSGDMILKYIEEHNLDRNTTLFVGNSITDHMAAMDAKVDFAYCDWGTEHFHEDENSAIILEEPKDLIVLIGGKNYDRNLCAQGL